jgi:hypothetical protein
MKTQLITILCTMAILFACTNSSRADTAPDPAMVVADAVVVRPLCFVATVLGSAFFVVSLPVAATSKSVKKTARALVVTPGKATFTRPLGDFNALLDY